MLQGFINICNIIANILYLQATLFMKIKLNWDALGIGTSMVCAIHCALLPVLVSSLPVLGINIIHNGFFEWGMIVLAFMVGVYSLFHGFVKHHRSYLPMFIFSVGFIFPGFKTILSSAGVLVFSHCCYTYYFGALLQLQALP